jgi:hypothetical protein
MDSRRHLHEGNNMKVLTPSDPRGPRVFTQRGRRGGKLKNVFKKGTDPTGVTTVKAKPGEVLPWQGSPLPYMSVEGYRDRCRTTSTALHSPIIMLERT